MSMNDLIKQKEKQLDELQNEILKLRKLSSQEEKEIEAQKNFEMFLNHKWLLIKDTFNRSLNLIRVHHLFINESNKCCASAYESFSFSKNGYFHFINKNPKEECIYKGQNYDLSVQIDFREQASKQTFIPDEQFVNEFKKFIKKQIKNQSIAYAYYMKDYEFPTNF